MPSQNRGYIVITNHFHEDPVNPKIVFANSIFLKYLGYELHEIVEKNPDIIFSEWDNETIIADILSSVSANIPWNGSFSVTKKSTECETLKFVIVPIRDDKGEILYYSCVSEKILSIPKSNDIALKELTEFVETMWHTHINFSDVVTFSPENLLKIDERGNITFINDKAKNQFGFEVGKNIFDNIINSDIESFKQFLAADHKNGNILRLDFDLEIDSDILNLQFKMWPISDALNKVLGYSVSVVDNTNKKNFIKELESLRKSDY